MNGDRIHIERSGTHFEMRGWNTTHQKQKLKADINQVELSWLHFEIGRTGLSIQGVMPLAVDAGVMSLMGELR
jgi:hypothetical protein